MSFSWPCERRDAHKPHPRTPAGWIAPEDSEQNAPAYLSGDGTKTTEAMCPGVGAHPSTMIGGQYR